MAPNAWYLRGRVLCLRCGSKYITPRALEVRIVLRIIPELHENPHSKFGTVWELGRIGGRWATAVSAKLLYGSILQFHHLQLHLSSSIVGIKSMQRWKIIFFGASWMEKCLFKVGLSFLLFCPKGIVSIFIFFDLWTFFWVWGKTRAGRLQVALIKRLLRDRFEISQVHWLQNLAVQTAE